MAMSISPMDMNVGGHHPPTSRILDSTGTAPCVAYFASLLSAGWLAFVANRISSQLRPSPFRPPSNNAPCATARRRAEPGGGSTRGGTAGPVRGGSQPRSAARHARRRAAADDHFDAALAGRALGAAGTASPAPTTRPFAARAAACGDAPGDAAVPRSRASERLPWARTGRGLGGELCGRGRAG
jgi:hypothetical protein